MRLLVLTVLLVLPGQTHGGLFGIRGLFRSGRKSIEILTGVVQQQISAIRGILETKVIPDVQESLKVVRESAYEFVNITKRMEQRIEESLDKLDDLAKTVNHVLDIVIVISCIALFAVCSKLNSSSRDEHLKYGYLTILMMISLITAIGVILRVFCVSVLQIDMSPSATIVCVIFLTTTVVAWEVLRLVYYLLCSVGVVVYFFILGPRLILYITVDGPIRWVWRAYKYADEMKSKKAFYFAVALHWTMLLISLMVYYLFMYIDESNDQAAFASVLASYIFFYAVAVYLYKYHQRPEPQERLRALYGGNVNGGQGRPLKNN
ncbi:uncharacterized protein LOC128552727 [Mercenaria mercenaria]|uniref:uncharacterized protein LOC128552727 n=1 Tax=Mercenaria mercenaria TaxID=6596 RepID=UPI00234EC3DA|nr:uncharacterized protein LOC128552727 [Mercenaria mercenaria]XP_053389751.1 uncharacterized protein LOC128552727 [Mercenaria mercenaria]XP_053389752.1 uncharacterized protein LOC128552727 [Mercenaria mercenaria]XP_053389753.1 uncharacterized protein LOC128552727 [Mercenaria mercenaria]XP_053389754.1 uncharacterized protein LOC128552727 [Mercenaria mercenaria]XP_053389755.1 uncharacterized protein LOC128552727 [Mercenaria mercenaria]